MHHTSWTWCVSDPNVLSWLISSKLDLHSLTYFSIMLLNFIFDFIFQFFIMLLEQLFILSSFVLKQLIEGLISERVFRLFF
jgi:hypothetical protein